MSSKKKISDIDKYYDSSFSMLKTLKTIFHYLKAEKKRLILGNIFAFFNAVFYVSGSALIGIIVQKFFEPYAKGELKLEDFNWTSFSLYLCALAAAFIIYGVLRYIESYLYIRVCYGLGTKLRAQIMYKLSKTPIKYYDQQQAGNLISIIINDINSVNDTLFQITTQLFTNFWNILLSIIAMLFVSSVLTIIVVPVSLFLFFVSFIVVGKSQRYFVANQNAFGKMNGYVEEMLTNTKVTNSFDRQEQVYKGLKQITKEIRNIAFKGDTSARFFEVWFQLVSNLLVLVISAIAAIFFVNEISVYGIAGFGSNSDGTASAALIVTFVSLNWNFITPFNGILNIVFSLQVGTASSNRVFKLSELNFKPREPENIEIDNIKGEVEFKNVYFKYLDNSSTYQLKNASFKVKPGQVVAFVGPTGAGKTTIINLLSKFYDYNEGSILIDGNELRNIKTNMLREHMTVVLQDSFLFNETIYDNLTLGNHNVSREQVIQAAKLTNIHHFIMTLPNDYDTVVENNGQNISQGERQLISLTRAILSNKNLLILDEATSSIDSRTEIIVQNSIRHLTENKTSFIIAHRLSTIKNADVIMVVNNGEIIESGNHEQLLAKKGFYFNLYHSQYK
ncbi:MULTISPECIES: ABC transporter ATP-binding protein [unclassified Mycoplasma]|uniref:ABC transporter ATP-binding protein n=1 Tax=unclassified Mycoplasma TaxID=2683645 RepID=UPI00211B8701|nr:MULTISPECIES: ABC transporter ATP-binding protein [unclassified Mycoplasma]UUM20061.1 ABC transporter ATP-binding protein/permease [Mycoplasma sp. 1578d]UUM25041.1 ABC transporter ATP-binding protein/permease [Mycoplasma sp. 3686d]